MSSLIKNDPNNNQGHYSSNSNVNFIRAWQDDIDNNNRGWTQGTFYLTKDTDRLYFAQTATELVPLNHFFRIWESPTAANGQKDHRVPNSIDYPNLSENDIFYWTDKNALIICTNPTTPSYTQLNPDTYLSATTSAVGVAATGTDNKNATVTTTVRDSSNNTSTGNFTLAPGNNNVSLGVDSENKVISISTKDTDTTYNIKADPKTISGKAAAEIILTGTPHINGTPGTSTDTEPSIKLVGTGINIDVNNNTNTITLTSATGVSSVSNNFGENGQFVTTIDNTITSADDDLIPTIGYGSTLGANDVLTYGSSAVFANGTANLDVYTRTQVDTLITQVNTSINNKIAEADALTYKGVVTSSNASQKLALANAHIGDTYKASGNITTTLSDENDNTVTVNAKTGDLIIATGTNVGGEENVTGWDVIPSGDDQSISVNTNRSDASINPGPANGITILDGTVPLGSIQVLGNTSNNGNIVATETQDGTMKTIYISHGAAGSAQTTYVKSGATTGQTNYTGATDGTTLSAGTMGTPTTISIPTITGIAYDGAGHITNITTATYSVTDTHATVDTFTSTVTSVTGGVGIVHNFKVDDNDVDDRGSNLKIVAKEGNANITITAAVDPETATPTNTIEISLVWGEFTLPPQT